MNYKKIIKNIIINEYNKIKIENRKIVYENIKSLTGKIKKLKDGLTEEIIKEKFPWLIEADFSDAVLGFYNEKLVWYNGIWHDGTWKDGTWEKGTWKSGTWHNGDWGGGIWKKGNWESLESHPNEKF
jgi:hypothetical protein